MQVAAPAGTAAAGDPILRKRSGRMRFSNLARALACARARRRVVRRSDLEHRARRRSRSSAFPSSPRPSRCRRRRAPDDRRARPRLSCTCVVERCPDTVSIASADVAHQVGVAVVEADADVEAVEPSSISSASAAASRAHSGSLRARDAHRPGPPALPSLRGCAARHPADCRLGVASLVGVAHVHAREVTERHLRRDASAACASATAACRRDSLADALRKVPPIGRRRSASTIGRVDRMQLEPRIGQPLGQLVTARRRDSRSASAWRRPRPPRSRGRRCRPGGRDAADARGTDAWKHRIGVQSQKVSWSAAEHDRLILHGSQHQVGRSFLSGGAEMRRRSSVPFRH